MVRICLTTHVHWVGAVVVQWLEHSTRTLYMRARYEFESRDPHGFSVKAESSSGEEENLARCGDTLAKVEDPCIDKIYHRNQYGVSVLPAVTSPI